jgi:dTDP-4-dehydrorhamnose 3,5-epimerase-like enzyme
MLPAIILGGNHSDSRGKLKYNNSFDLSQVKRIYSILLNQKCIRGWQGHKIEQRWFAAISGTFNIKLILVDNWNKPSVNLPKKKFELSSDSLDVLHVPAGYLTSIEAVEDNSIILVMSDYCLNEIKDEYKFSEKYFKI